MAIDDAYAGPEEYRDAAGNSDDGEEVAITRHLLAVSRGLERLAGQYFNQETAARIWKGKDTPSLRVAGGPSLCPGIASRSGLAVAIDTAGDGTFSTAVSASTFMLRPVDAEFGAEPSPWRELYYRPLVAGWSSDAPNNWCSLYDVQVTATYGWPAVPALIKEFTIELTRLWRVEGPRATGRMYESADALFATSLDAQRICEKLVATYHPTGIAIG